jgi:hypothetical protein
VTKANIEKIKDIIWEPDETCPDASVFAILDAARNERVFELLVSLSPDSACLFSGKLPRVLAKAVPYLVMLERDTPFTDAILTEGWGDSWGIYFTSDLDLGNLRHHFRRFLKVKNKRTKKTLFFRYFDPRVLRVYLPTCTGEELTYVLDPLHRCVVEGEDSADLQIYSLQHPLFQGQDVRLETRTVRVDDFSAKTS